MSPTLEALATSRLIIRHYGDQTPCWDIYPVSDPTGFTSGYAFACKNSCSQGKFIDSWRVGSARVKLPPAPGLVYARLNWQTKFYTTSGDGDNDVEKSCHVVIAVVDGGYALPGPNDTLYGQTNLDVKMEVRGALQDGKDSIEFQFTPPMDRQAGARWDRCLWDVRNVGLTLFLK